MPNSLTWVVMPNGIDPATGRARLSLTASPDVTSNSGTIGDSVLADWPTQVAALAGQLTLQVAGPTKSRLPLTITSPAPEQSLWSVVFPASAPVNPPPEGIYELMEPLVTAVAYDKAHAAAAALYDEVLRTSPTDALRPDHPVARAVAAFGRLTATVAGDVAARGARPLPGAVGDLVGDLLDPARLTPERLDGAVAELRAAGLIAEAAVAPLVPLVVRQRRAAGPSARGRAANGNGNGAPIAPPPADGPLDDIRPLSSADVHQVIGLIGDHPAMARRLGLVIDVEVAVVDALRGEQTVRVMSGDGLPLDHRFTTVRHPWSRTLLDAPAGRFVMAAGPDGNGEVREGQLDLRPGGAEYSVNDLDVRSVARQLQLLATTMAHDEGQRAADERAAAAAPGTSAPAAGPGPAGGGIVLPARRDPGLTIAQAGRRAGVVAAGLALAARMADTAGAVSAPGTADEPGGADEPVVLFADDVTAGYRVDVKRDGAPFRSLMRRVSSYQLAGPGRPPPVVVHDEGVVEPVTGVYEELPDGTSTFTVGEEVLTWDGWSAATPLPGPVVVGEERAADGSIETVGQPDPGTLAGYGLSMATRVEPGSLPALRYGSTYRLRARAVDLAGNSLPEADTDARFATAPAVFRRHEPVPAPTLVPRQAFRTGETLTDLVVTTDGDGNAIGGTTERHLVPPSSPQRMAERLGAFDAAFGPDTPQRKAARAALLAVARKEAGSLTDPTIPGPNGTPVPVRGISVVAPAGGPPAATLPLPPGEALPAGQYVVHDTDALQVPYVPDPAATGVNLMPFPPSGPDGGTYATYGTGPWPDRRPARLVARAVTDEEFGVRTVTTPTGDVLEVRLAPGDRVHAAVASTVAPEVVAKMDPLTGNGPHLAVDGWVLAFSPRRPLTLVHATRRPHEAPTLDVKSVRVRAKGSTALQFTAELGAHGPTSGHLDAVATWTEVTDHGIGPLDVSERRVVLDSRDVGRDDTTFTETLSHDFGDTRGRVVTVTPVAATRFRDVFPDLPVGDPRTLKAGPATPVKVRNTRSVPPPVVHSTVPTFRWERTLTNGVFTSTRVATGVRVYLGRPWLVTGAGEALGVVTYTTADDSVAASTPPGAAHVTTRLVSRVGPDVLEPSPAMAPLSAASFGSTDAHPFVPREVPALDGDTDAPRLTVVAHEARFDERRGLWFADVPLTARQNAPYLVQLAVVRYQDNGLPGCQVSRIVRTDWVPVPGQQQVTVTRSGPDRAKVSVKGVNGKVGRRYEAALEPRLRDRPAGAPKEVGETDITVPAGPPLDLVQSSQAPGPDGGLRARGTVTIATTDAAERARLAAGRLVVREVQRGEDIRFPGGAERIVWLETVDWEDLMLS